MPLGRRELFTRASLGRSCASKQLAPQRWPHPWRIIFSKTISLSPSNDERPMNDSIAAVKNERTNDEACRKADGEVRMAFAEISPGVVSRAKCGDEDAFHLIFNRYGRPVLSFIHNFVHDRELAEELAQETFGRAHRNLGGLKDDLRLSTWLFGIARNVVREAARQARKDDMKVGLDEPESLRLESKGILPEGALLDRELTEAIRKALIALDEDKRTVF